LCLKNDIFFFKKKNVQLKSSKGHHCILNLILSIIPIFFRFSKFVFSILFYFFFFYFNKTNQTNKTYIEIAHFANVNFLEEDHHNQTTSTSTAIENKQNKPTNFDMNVERIPSEAEILIAKASYSQKSGKFEDSIKLLEESEKSFSKTAEQTRSSLKTSGGFSKLIRRDSVREDEKFLITIQLKRATLFNKLGKHKDALSVLNVTIPLIGNEITTEAWKSYRERAIALFKLNLHEQSIESFDKSL